ncbi:hypothetical protein L8C07_05090 [Paenibacillus sp. CMAA1739]|uniref:hypothetical protein n=1 Tax=Paenibacillus ottowii TaxID=2315729 RepID=UPI002DB5FD0B|nr:hypothetical protein [Paenibacillus sp. CMAA1739]MEC4565311.1 hypothetical protein [Paenibacillus sp. CMAA1739]
MGHLSSTNAVPAMTSATTPSGVASASSEYNPSATTAWMAFDRTGRYWATNSTQTGWIKYKLPNQIIIQNYNITSHSTEYQGSPKNWTFEGSNDDMNWTVLDTQSNQTGWTASQTRKYITNNKQSYQYYRLNINGVSGNYPRVVIAEWEMYEYIFDDKFLLSVDDQYIAYTPMIISDTTLIPKMTSNNTPSGIVDASNTWGANYPYKAFDGVGGAGGVWIAAVGSLPAWISYEFTNATEITSYAIKSSTPSRQPKKWTFEGYIDSRWIVLDKRDNVTDWVNGTKKVFTISESKSCKKYRLNIELVNGDPTYLEVDEIEMYGIIDYGKIKYLPSASEDDFISRGLDKSTQINLEETLKYKEYVTSNANALGAGKVYTRLVDPNKTPIKSIIIS